MATIHNVAQQAGVSTSTVSRAFRNDSSITPEKRKAVLHAAKSLGYTPNLLARSLKSNKSNIIGLDVCNVDNPFYITIIKVVEEELKKLGYHLLLTYSNGDVLEERNNIELFAGTCVEGIILMPTSRKNEDLVQMLIHKGVTFVQLFTTAYEFMDCVTVLDDMGTYYAVSHLLKKGHSKILLLNVDTPYNKDRADGYRKAFDEHGIIYDDSYIITLGGIVGEQTQIEQLIQQFMPTAILAGTYMIGKNVIQACKHLGLKVPRDISFVTFDDVEWPELLNITAVAQPIQYIGLTSVRMLMDRIDGRNTSPLPVVSAMEPKLIVRKSVLALGAQHLVVKGG